MNVTIVLEKSNNEWFGSCQVPGSFISTVANTVAQITANIKDLIQDHIDHEGATEVEYQGVLVDAIQFDYQYDLSGLFEHFAVLNVSEIAKATGINKSLLLQYKQGLKSASEKQAKRIEATIHALAKELLSVSVC